MTITPTFHFVCRYCGESFELFGHQVTSESDFSIDCQLNDSESHALESAGLWDDVCRHCMPIHAKASQDHDDMKASRCPIEEPDL